MRRLTPKDIGCRYKSALRWKQRVRSGQGQNDDEERDHTYLMTVTQETKTKGAAELNDMIQTRKEIHLKQGSDITNIFGYQSPTVNEVNIDEIDHITLCSTATLIHRELIDEGKLEVTRTTSNSNINGIGGVAKGKIVEIRLDSRNKEKSIVVNATVVDDIMQLPIKDKERFN